jgi:photosystem II stability/assembly factor-like uncharacterized protein
MTPLLHADCPTGPKTRSGSGDHGRRERRLVMPNMSTKPIRQRIAIVLLLTLLSHHGLAQTWTQTSAPETNWTAVACSADGSRIAAVTCCLGLVYLSTNSGMTWSSCNAPLTNYQSVSISADGATLIASTSQGVLFVSTNGGTSWSVSAVPGASCYSFGCSADGVRWIVGGQAGVSLSFDQGATWNTDTNFVFGLVASSADGEILMGYETMRALSFSSDSGMSWTTRTNGRSSPGFALALAVSADGTQLAKTTVPFLTGHQPIFCMVTISTNSGLTWVRAGLPSLAYIAIASSADGHKLVAQCLVTGTNAPIYTSTDAGATWVGNIVPGGEQWMASGAVASSADGDRLVAVANQHGIYTWHTTPSPTLNTRISGDQVVLSWLVPSTRFELQQTLSLDSPGWTGVGAPTTLNFKNLNSEVRLPKSPSPVFYRLVLRAQ